MNEKEFKPIAKEILAGFGLTTFDVPVKDRVLTPDFEVHGAGDKYVIELKIKDDDPEEVAEDIEQLTKGTVVSKSIPIGPRNALAGIIRKGVQQMMEHDPSHAMFRVIWLHCSGRDPELHYRRFQSTLFGSETLFSLRVPHTMTCYYFHASAFYSWKQDLDGALLTYNNKAQLCINTLSSKAPEFRKSQIGLAMAKGLCDPDKVEGVERGVMIADCNLSRKDPGPILEFLQRKYQLDHLQPIPMQQHTGMVVVQNDGEN